MNVKSAFLLTVLGALSTLALADDHIVDFDHEVDFSGIKTFTLRKAEIRINQPDIRHPIVQERSTAAIREMLIARGLKETAENADVMVDWELTGQGFAINPWGRAIPTNNTRTGNRGQAPDDFLEGLLVVDIVRRENELLIWRGVYRDKESDTAKLAKNLTGDIKKLFAQYPGKK